MLMEKAPRLTASQNEKQKGKRKIQKIKAFSLGLL